MTFQPSDERKTQKQLQAFNDASFANIVTVSSADMLDYQSPIMVIASEIRQEFENNVCKVVQNMGIKVDKEELVKALEHDREQYEKGYKCAEEKVGKYGRWNDGDEILPNSDRKVLVQTNTESVFLGCYIDEFGLWMTDSGLHLRRDYITRWAEIPPVEQENKDECNNT